MLGTLLEGGRLILQAREKKKKVPQVIEKSSSSSSGGKAHGKRRAVGEEELGTSTDSLATPPNVGVSIAGEVFSDAKDTLIAPAAPATAEIEEKEQRTITQENEKEAAAKYWRSVATNAAYAPMTLHYSMEKGFMGDSWIGALGLAASAVGLGEVWRSTAAGAE